MTEIKDEIVAGKIRDVKKAQLRVSEAIDSLFEELSAAVGQNRITKKEAASIRSGFKGR